MRLHSWAPVAIAAVAVVVVAALAVAIVQVRTPAQPPRSGVSARPSGTPTAAATRDAVAAPVAPTRLHRVAPVTAAGRVAPGYRVTVSGPGHCFSTSLFDDRLWRCFRGNTILDPCWQAGPRTVLCLPVPWSRQVTRVRLTAPLPAGQDFGRRVWGLRLAVGAGIGCTAATGAVGTAGGRPVSYVCARGWALLGNGPDRSQATWRMAAARLVGDHYRARGSRPLTSAWVTTVP